MLPRTAVNPPTSSCRLRILVVDDDRVSRKFLTTLIERSGCESIEACDGQEGLAKARELQPEIIITDWQMPFMDGIDLVRALRASSNAYRPYIILVTSLEAENKQVEAFDAGADDFIGKPLETKIVSARLRAGQRMTQLMRENERHLTELQRYSEQLTHSNQRLRELAETDELTGLANRRHAMEQMLREWSASQRRRSPLSCMVVDLVGLKRINDVHGHERGDVVLKTVAAVVKQVVHTQDIVCRFGGDKFLVICPGTSLDLIMSCGQRLVSTLASFEIDAEGHFLSLAIGAAERRLDLDHPQALINVAERSTKIAKQSGKNQVYAGQREEDGRSTRGLTDGVDQQCAYKEGASSRTALLMTAR